MNEPARWIPAPVPSLKQKGLALPKRKKYPAFLAYPSDFLSDPKVGTLDNKLLGAYWRLIMYCWIGGFIPADEEALRKLSSAGSKKDWERIKKEIIPLFRIRRRSNGSEVLVHKRLEEELRKLKHKSKLGKLAAGKRWDADASNPHMRNVCLSRSSSSSISSSTKGPNSPIKKRAEKSAWRIHSLIDEKLQSYGAGGKHQHAGLYHKMCQYLPEPLIMAAIARVNDKMLEARAASIASKDLHRYFIGVVRSMCKEEGIESPINWKEK
jgi:uncharacterized protein YdaU (DUF1376 family)